MSIGPILTNEIPPESPCWARQGCVIIMSMVSNPTDHHCKVHLKNSVHLTYPFVSVWVFPDSDERDTKRKPLISSIRRPYPDIHCIQQCGSPLQSAHQKLRPSHMHLHISLYISVAIHPIHPNETSKESRCWALQRRTSTMCMPLNPMNQHCTMHLKNSHFICTPAYPCISPWIFTQFQRTKCRKKALHQLYKRVVSSHPRDALPQITIAKCAPKIQSISCALMYISVTIDPISTKEIPKESPWWPLRRRHMAMIMGLIPMYHHCKVHAKNFVHRCTKIYILVYLCEYSPDSNEPNTTRKPLMSSTGTCYRYIHAVQCHGLLNYGAIMSGKQRQGR